MDKETVIGYQKMRETLRKVKEHKPRTIYEVFDEKDSYQQALEDILKASTVGEMIKIADRVLRENGKR